MGKLLTSIVIGSLLGVIGSKFLFVGSALSLIPWAMIGILLGYISLDSKDALKNGCAYGFFLSFVFMLAGYSGTASLISRFPFFALLGIFGAFCGAMLAFIGLFLKNRFKILQ